MRIVSLLPAATEILFALDLGEHVVGVSHACDHPPEARRRPVVVHAAVDPGLPSRELDREVADAVASGRPLYVLDAEALRALQPDLIVTQEICGVCAPGPADLEGVLDLLDWPVQVVTLGADSLAGVLEDIRTLAGAAGVPERGERLARSLERRLTRVAQAAACPGRPTVACIEWLDPPFVAGHWIPEMVALAGGVDVLGWPGQPARRSDWSEVAAADPDVLVLMPCGLSIGATRARLAEPAADPDFRRLRAVLEGRVYAVDAGSHFSRPGPRLVDGVEILAGILHREQLGEPTAALRISARELRATVPRPGR